MKYDKILWRIRQRIFDYDGTPNEAKAERLLSKVKRKAEASRIKAKTVGAYSHLTRNELRKSGTCEPDWF